jgi:hypothetical protein
MKLNLKDVTLCAISSVSIENTLKALKYSMKDINFAEVKFITDHKMNEPDIEWIECEKLDYAGYNLFNVNELHKHINTKFVLKIHADGFVLHADKWRDEFLEYDYIGALWANNPEMGWVDERRVGNGGFTLRSKGLIEAASKYNFPDRLRTTTQWNEDGYFCITYRHLFQEKGFKYAPIDVAKYFSHEGWCPEINGIYPFGFHGKHHTNCLSLLDQI